LLIHTRQKIIYIFNGTDYSFWSKINHLRTQSSFPVWQIVLKMKYIKYSQGFSLIGKHNFWPNMNHIPAHMWTTNKIQSNLWLGNCLLLPVGGRSIYTWHVHDFMRWQLFFPSTL
jgi:hypothetical protein